MSAYEVHVILGGPIRVPADATVGDEYTVTGRVRVVAIEDDLVDVRSDLDPNRPFLLPGMRKYTIAIQHLDDRD